MADYRKLISFGKSSYVVSLPKGWIQKNNLKKGDLIPIDDNGQNLTLFAHTASKDEQPEQQIAIEVDGKSIEQIKREIIAAYISDHKVISLTGKEVKEKAKEIQSVLHNLMALEVMEQDAEKIVARDFLNMKEISVPELVKKMDAITKAMIADTKQTFDDDLYENVFIRDEDVNRLSYLAYRALRYGLKHPMIATQNFKLSSTELLNLWMVTDKLEAIADETKRTARYMQRIKLPKKEQRTVVATFALIEKNYTDMMKSYYDKDKKVAHEVSARKEAIIKKIKNLYEDNDKIKWIAALTEHMKVLTYEIHEIARSIYE